MALYKRDILPFAVIFLWSCCFISLNFYKDFPCTHDAALYLSLAKSFQKGHGYEDISSPFRQNFLHVTSGFSLLLSMYWKFIHPNIAILKFFLAFLMICGSWACYVFMKNFMPLPHAFGIALAFSSCWWFVNIGNSVLSESVFIPLFYITCMYTLKSEKPLVQRRNGWIALFGWVILSRVRPLGLPLFLAYSILLVKRKEWKKVLVGMLILCIWIVFEKLSVIKDAPSVGYVDYFNKEFPIFSSHLYHAIGELFDSTVHNIWSFAGSMYANILFPYFYNLVTMNPVKRLIVVGLFINGCYGTWILWKLKPGIRPIFFAALFYWITVFTWAESTTMFRYAYPFFPFLLLIMLVPVHHALGRVNSSWRNAIILGIIGVVIINQAWQSFNQSYEDPFVPDRNSFNALHSYISSLPQKPDIILSPQNYYTFLKTGVYSLSTFVNMQDIYTYASHNPFKNIWLIVNNTKAVLPTPIRCDSLSIIPDTTALRIQGIWSLYRIKEIQFSAKH